MSLVTSKVPDFQNRKVPEYQLAGLNLEHCLSSQQVICYRYNH